MKLKNLPAGTYSKISAIYVSILDGGGCTCDNCGRIIANIVTVKNEDINKQYTIGQDCAKNLFSDKENKEIDRLIKDGIRADKCKIERAKRTTWQAAYNEVKELYYANGGKDAMINEPGDRIIYNAALATIQTKTGIHISYNR